MSRRFEVARVLVAVVVATTVIAAIAFTVLRDPRHRADTRSTDRSTPLYWYDPMHPGEHFEKPGKSPFMDMQLVPRYAGPMPAGAASIDGIAIDPRIVETLGVRFAAVEPGNFARDVDTVGVVGVDEHRIEAIQVREPGWVERLDVRAAGDAVHRGQLLAQVYSPDLLATQEELLIARDAKDPELLEAARHRLALFGVSNEQIGRIEKRGVERCVDYYAPFDGYVMELGVRQGAAVVPATTLFELADLASVWIMAEVPEAQAAWIKAGDPAIAEVPALPGERFEGRIDYLYPELNEATRTLKVRLVIKNPRRHLRPGMFASAHLSGAAVSDVLTVPSEAVIDTGTRRVIIVADEGMHFRAVPVRIGAERGGRSQILEGLARGQTVVASGQFLIDSEANLRGALDNLAGSKTSTPTDARSTVMPSPSTVAPEGAH